MTEQKHTPGPWKVTRRGIMALNSETGRYGGVVCQPNWCGFDPDDVWLDIPREANARLIAAAPDLLAEVKDWLRDSDGWSVAELRKRYDEKAVQRILRSRAAIAKAEGKE